MFIMFFPIFTRFYSGRLPLCSTIQTDDLSTYHKKMISSIILLQMQQKGQHTITWSQQLLLAKLTEEPEFVNEF